MTAAESRPETQMVTPSPSQFLVAFSAPNYQAEILAVCTATEHLLECEKPMGNILIFTNSLSTLPALNSADPEQMIQGQLAQFAVSVQCMLAYVGLTRKATADKLAKIGSQALQIQNPVTYREAKTLLHSRYNGDLKKDNSSYQAHLGPNWRLEWVQQTTVFCLRSGHCGLNGHLKRICISDFSLCECGTAGQTPDHVLQSCTNFAERHKRMSVQQLVLDLISDLHNC